MTSPAKKYNALEAALISWIKAVSRQQVPSVLPFSFSIFEESINDIDSNTLTYLINHLVLPPKLPQSDDHTPDKDVVLCRFVTSAIERYRESTTLAVWQSVLGMMDNLSSVLRTPNLVRENVHALMANSWDRDVIVLPIRAQNACVMIRQLGHSVIYECFEVDPPNATVMGATGRIVRTFPGPSLTIPAASIPDCLQSELASFLAQMDADILEESVAHSKKGGVKVEEFRDTADPHHITGLFMAILRGLPGSRASQDRRITKRTRNNILWDKSYLPWRRSPMWLIIRVAMHTTLHRAGCADEYKRFLLFLLSDLLSLGTTRGISTELLFCLQRKIANRLQKLQASGQSFLPGPLLSTVRVAIEESKEVLDSRWCAIRRTQEARSEWNPSSLDVAADCNLSLPSSLPYILQRISVKPHLPLSEPSAPKIVPRLFQNADAMDDFNAHRLERVLQDEQGTALMDFESFVIQSLASFSPQHLAERIDIEEYQRCIEVYLATAKPAYHGNPETSSIMLLTVFLIWMVLDKVAIHYLPQLAFYSPEVPLSLFEPLLLSRRLHLNRLSELQSYIRSRYNDARFGSIFYEKVEPTSFSIRYFDQSHDMAQKLTRIEANARSQRLEKLTEFSRAMQTYEDRITSAQNLAHECQPGGVSKKRCRKCRLLGKAANMTINVHEWPLPADPLKAKAVVFETMPPAHFDIWRTTTYRLLRVVCRINQPQTPSAPAYAFISTFKGLKGFVSTVTHSGVSYASTTKSFQQSHYASIKASQATKDKVCVPSALNFYVYDSQGSHWITPQSFADSTVAPYCDPQPTKSGNFSGLSYSLTGTHHPPNRPIAEAVHHINLDANQFSAYGTLRSGPHLQWMNILKELRARTLSVSESEIQTLVVQAAFQVGPFISDQYQWHSLLQTSQLGICILTEIQTYIGEISDNWSHANGLLTVILLINRISSSCTGQIMISRCSKALMAARSCAFSWVETLVAQLSEKEYSTTSDSQEHQLVVALIACLSTYDVGPEGYETIITSENNLKIFIQSLILLHGNAPSDQLIFRRHSARIDRIAHSLIPTIDRVVFAHPAVLDDTIQAIWSAYDFRTEPWTIMSSRWWSTRVRSDVTSEREVSLCLDMLTGLLLVDGRPLSDLPRAILEHPVYLRLFGKIKMQVAPSLRPGMDYATAKEIQGFGGYRYHFGLAGSDLIIQATRGQSLHELIPHGIFDRDVPISFAQDFHHWLYIPSSGRLADANVDFRPLSSPWESTPEGWILTFQSPTTILATRDPYRHKILVDIRSTTCKIITGRLKTFEEPQNIHTTVDHQHVLQVSLPRYKLSFQLRNGHLESSNFRGMIVDLDQSCGCLYGLQQRLVLRSVPFAGQDRLSQQFVLIPFGPVQLSSDGNHVSARVRVETEKNVRYFKYDIDRILNAVASSTSFLSELYCIYLHALTSYCLPDPLLGRTGMEEALRRLASARCKSFQGLSTDEKELLNNLAQLLPDREWYPTHLRGMETVQWKLLSPLSQHYAYHVLVQSILDYHEQISTFHPDKTNLDTQNEKRKGLIHHLHIRSASRLYQLYPGQHTRDLAATAIDQIYPDPNKNAPHLRIKSDSLHASATQYASDMSALVQAWSTRLNVVSDLWNTLLSFKTIAHDRSAFSASYSKSYLNPDLGSCLLPIYELCQHKDSEALQAQFTVTMSAMAYAGTPRPLLETILAFAISPRFRNLRPPHSWNIYTLADGVSPSRHAIERLILHYALPIDQCPFLPDRISGEKLKTYNKRRRAAYAEICNAEANQLATKVLACWPRASAIQPLYNDLFQPNPAGYQVAIKEIFSSCQKNLQLFEFVRQVQAQLSALRTASSPSPFASLLWTPSSPSPAKQSHGPKDLLQLLQQKFPPDNLPDMPNQPLLGQHSAAPSLGDHLPHNSRLNSLIAELTCSNSSNKPLLRRYGQSLASSRDCLWRGGRMLEGMDVDLGSLVQALESYVEECHQHASIVLTKVVSALSPERELDFILALVNYWPKPTPVDLLSLLSGKECHPSTAPVSVSRWNHSLRCFAYSLMCLQQSQRLLSYAIADAIDELQKELNNMITNATLSADPDDWLLIQIQGNFCARHIQKSVAKEMILPSEEGNTLLQLNMGEGKTSVIIPLVASSLANGINLTRIIILKPLVNAMFSLLVQRLTGLVNRRIFYLPISRDLRPDRSVTTRIFTLFRTCTEEGGVLLAQPEHILSLKLMGIDLSKASFRRSSVDRSNSDTLLECQKWLLMRSRDVLDESDEVLSVQYQLVYTTGRQIPFENSPDRWLAIQEALNWMKEEATGLSLTNAAGLQVGTAIHGEFPVIRVLDSQTGQQLMALLVRRCTDSGRLRLLPVWLRQQAASFISGCEINETLLKDNTSDRIWKYLLIYRGLLGFGILQFIFEQKRWRVNFGLDPTRTLLAVPYRAKDVPAIRADFGHPEVAICLTCLSYYYGGLTMEQLGNCFQILLKLDNPVPVYEAWVAGYDAVPNHLRQLGGINLDDVEQRERVLFPLFRKHQAVVDFYLSRVVFPREAKQFPTKLSTSSWDLAERKTNVTTGFSGTNDNQDLLPTTITQRDPLNQLGTNAQVLSHLLRRENDHYRALHGRNGCLLSSTDVLRSIVKEDPPLRVLLDVGAQMLDMQSLEIARTWLSLETEIEAVVYFNDKDRLVVMRRDHSVEPLESTHYLHSLDLCGIYLDDAHTRGTDLKFPKNFRGAVTLGPNLTKDRLVQGCMRMRKLGHGHSLIFFAPPEVDDAIRLLHPGDHTSPVTVKDILRWTIHNTCHHIIRHLPHWGEQGVDYHKRRKAWDEYNLCPAGPAALEKLVSAWESIDARTLEQLYGQTCQESHQHAAYRIPEMNAHLNKLELGLTSGMRMDEEQEREVQYEVEKERQVQRPPPAQPAVHELHPDVVYLVDHGCFVRNSPVFTSLFSNLEHLGQHPWSAHLLATKDFSTTIIGTAVESMDYLRPVQWILTIRNNPSIVVLSPFEANALLPRIRKSNKVHLHVYVPRVNESMQSTESLRFLAIPSLPMDWQGPSSVDIAQLNLWAGQLYLKDYNSYIELRNILGLVGEETRFSKDQLWDADGFVRPEHRTGEMAKLCQFKTSPVPFLRQLISLRQRGAPFDRTHMGKILDGQLLTAKDFRTQQLPS